jgi:SAM-dependent methyltransferase
MTNIHPTAAEGYGQAADVYARGRPGFPPEALDWLRTDLQLAPGTSVLELGAGTGKFTQLLAQTGASVTAVEPVAAMLARLTSGLPGIHALQARAQEVPVAAASMDAVVCAQSFHWFATPDTLAEIRRVLKPGGTLGLAWNVRDASVSWVAELERIVNRHEGDAPRYYDGEWRQVFPAPGFGPFLHRTVAHVHSGSAEHVIVDRAASVSFIAALPEEARRQVLDEVREFIAATPELAGQATVGLPYVTNLYWCKVNA